MEQPAAEILGVNMTFKFEIQVPVGQWNSSKKKNYLQLQPHATDSQESSMCSISSRKWEIPGWLFAVFQRSREKPEEERGRLPHAPCKILFLILSMAVR